jgi:hypothetical protein
LDVIPPISETVYNELLPRDYQKVGNRRRATLAVEEMRGSGVEILYLADAPSSVSPVCLWALTI